MYHETFALFSAYNVWANERLYAAASTLGPERLNEDRGVFFRSMAGTLNHLLVTDRIWLRRLTGEGEAPDRLDATLFAEFEPLREARIAEDARLSRYVGGLSEEELASDFSYRTISQPRAITQARASALLHLFNHQTHHRGQAHAILTGFGLDAPSLDMIRFQREGGGSLAGGRDQT